MDDDSQGEQVLCIPAATFSKVAFQGFRPWTQSDFSELLYGCATFQPRDAVESDLTWKQVIPYCFVQEGDGSILWYRRVKGTGEGRLLGKASLGIGGHVNMGDHLVHSTTDRAHTGIRMVEGALRREFLEELGADQLELQFLGLLNDDSDAVGRVHLGAVYRCTKLRVNSAIKREDQGVKVLGFFDLHRPPMAVQETESWSRIVWDWLIRAQEETVER